MKFSKQYFIFTLLMLFTDISLSASNRGLEIINNSELMMKSQTEKIQYKMELISETGDIHQTRIVRSYFKKYTKKEITLQKFESPPVIEDSGMMIVDRDQTMNDIWMYMPATRRLRRLSGAEKSNWYMGTEFAYEDFEGYQIDKYKYSFLKDKSCMGNKRCHLVEALPGTNAEKSSSGYGKKIYWLETTSLYPVRVELYNKDMVLVKKSDTSQPVSIGKYWRPKTVSMRNLITKKVTRITVLLRELDKHIDDYYLSKRYLRKD